MNKKQQVIMKILASAAVALATGVAGAAPASADSNPAGTNPNPFATLSCSCPQTARPSGPALNDEIDRGIRAGLSAQLPGLPAPAHPNQPRP
jgi:hypothetical protein